MDRKDSFMREAERAVIESTVRTKHHEEAEAKAKAEAAQLVLERERLVLEYTRRQIENDRNPFTGKN